MILNKLASHLLSLESAGVDVEALGGFIACIVQEKMVKDLLLKWEEEIAADVAYSTERLLKFLDMKAKASMANGTINASATKNTSSTSGWKDARPKMSTSALTTSVNQRYCAVYERSNHDTSFSHELMQIQIADWCDFAREK